MNSFRHRHRLGRLVIGLPALSLLIAAAGCSSTDDAPEATVPTPEASVTKLCRDLDKVLPRKVDGLERNDPEPSSELTAAWGSPAIILRCGVPWPDAAAKASSNPATVDNVEWIVDELGDGTQQMTTGSRRAYVEVTIPKDLVSQVGAGPLVDLAGPIKKAIPKGIAD
ncbi:DUF3515 family protein [Streptomyces sp. SID8379]|uniref:DUF3515 domain-containing protein n=1 Tax=unclassified Streptomyces TaxID=2593676 RepID=UPI000477B197|nr:DUF3515 domain-containing protein [Streptomyces sp. HmicA12]MYW65292.1 DUF3515 family protein [Streptomyces sp. SID8379]